MTMIMILDDSPTVIMSLSQILIKAGYEVATAANGKEGVDQLSGGLKPNVILTDLNMPEMDGIAFIKEARKTAATKFTPIIVLSGDSDGRKRDDAKSAGASGWLAKPPQANQLLYVVKQLLPST
ncbi:MAG: two-component system sensor histidine kinase/response regulator [Acidocella sp. 20-57-95]|jgi:two-component system chemotaxis response regulator CheY|nr:MAG: two-component system sensor histidine kinase/response regulator [Acidocella sp. 20-57-95]OYV62288.1 MAG: two-component system sensor histidine kinase/response regulator [Acidocella sp. 21-58-7]HQT63337.1 response regulator [Acidocella sp.]HQU03946.1 response regulator [Acidocella sp.]